MSNEINDGVTVVNTARDSTRGCRMVSTALTTAVHIEISSLERSAPWKLGRMLMPRERVLLPQGRARICRRNPLGMSAPAFLGRADPLPDEKREVNGSMEAKVVAA